MATKDRRNSIPDAVADTVAEADDATLRAIVDFVQAELSDRREELHEIEPGPGEELVETSEEPGYTRVVLRQPCAEGCTDCPHGPYLYHVYAERQVDGSPSLHWSYVGRVYDGSFENGGSPSE